MEEALITCIWTLLLAIDAVVLCGIAIVGVVGGVVSFLHGRG